MTQHVQSVFSVKTGSRSHENCTHGMTRTTRFGKTECSFCGAEKCETCDGTGTIKHVIHGYDHNRDMPTVGTKTEPCPHPNCANGWRV